MCILSRTSHSAPIPNSLKLWGFTQTGDSGAPEVSDACLRAWRAHTDYGEGLSDPAAILIRTSTGATTATSPHPSSTSSTAAAAAPGEATGTSTTNATTAVAATATTDGDGKQQVAWFWEALAGLTPTERAIVWRFATGKSIPPSNAANFAAMDLPFTLVRRSCVTNSSASGSGRTSTDGPSRKHNSSGDNSSATPGPRSGLALGLGSIRAATCFHQLQLPPAPGFSSVLALRHALLESAAEANAAANLALSSDAAGGGGADGNGEAIFDDSFAARTRRLQAAVARAAVEAGVSISARNSTGNNKGLGSVDAAKMRAELRKQFPKAHQCKMCGCGPVEHSACADLQTHHGEEVQGGKLSNACPQCGWFSPSIQDWPAWDGHVHAGE